MNPGPSDPSPADKIQAALDDLVAQRRRQRQQGMPPTPAPTRNASAAPLAEPRPKLRWVLVGLLALTVHAAGIYWYTQSKQSPGNLVLVVEPAPNPANDHSSAPPAADAPPTDVVGSSRAAPAASGAAGLARQDIPKNAGVIEHNGQRIIVPSSPPSAASSRARTVVATPVAPSAPPQWQAPSAVSAPHPSVQDHAKAAKDFAYYHFRYKYKAGSTNYAVTSQSVRIERTEEVPSWNRYRSTGEVGLEYYDNASFRRTTRRFEVLTEEKDGQATAIEITVK